MKLYHVTLLFILIALGPILLTDLQTHNLKAMYVSKNRLDDAFDHAIDSAAKELLQVADNRTILLNKDAAMNTFYQSMYASLGIMVSVDQQELLQQYIPIMTVISEEGYYIYYTDEDIDSNGATYYCKRWTPMFPFGYEDNEFIYGFTLGDRITLYDKHNLLDSSGEQKVFYMNYKELQTSEKYKTFRDLRPTHFLLNDETYLSIRKGVIITSIEETMSYFMNQYNKIARNYGITYQFTVPILDNSDFVRSIEHTSILIIFQGYPYGIGIDELYNRVSVAGANINKETVYYVEQKNWYYLYHKESCSVVMDLTAEVDIYRPYYNISDCVADGAYACSLCFPETSVTVPDYLR